MKRHFLLIGIISVWFGGFVACVSDVVVPQPDGSLPDGNLPDATPSDQNTPDVPTSDAGPDGCGSSTTLSCGAGTPCQLGGQYCCYKSGLSGICGAIDAGDAGPCNETAGSGTFRCTDNSECDSGTVCCAYVRNMMQPATNPREWTSSCAVQCPFSSASTAAHRILCKCDQDCASNIFCKPDDGGSLFDGSVANGIPPGYKSCQP